MMHKPLQKPNTLVLLLFALALACLVGFVPRGAAAQTPCMGDVVHFRDVLFLDISVTPPSVAASSFLAEWPSSFPVTTTLRPNDLTYRFLVWNSPASLVLPLGETITIRNDGPSVSVSDSLTWGLTDIGRGQSVSFTGPMWVFVEAATVTDGPLCVMSSWWVSPTATALPVLVTATPVPPTATPVALPLAEQSYELSRQMAAFNIAVGVVVIGLLVFLLLKLRG